MSCMHKCFGCTKLKNPNQFPIVFLCLSDIWIAMSFYFEIEWSEVKKKILSPPSFSMLYILIKIIWLQSKSLWKQAASRSSRTLKHTLAYLHSWCVSLFHFQEYSEDSNSEPNVDLENQYYNSKALKEDDPKAALSSFQKVKQHSVNYNHIFITIWFIVYTQVFFIYLYNMCINCLLPMDKLGNVIGYMPFTCNELIPANTITPIIVIMYII